MARGSRALLVATLACLLTVFAGSLASVTGQPLLGVGGAVGLLAAVALMMGLYAAAVGLAIVVHELGHYAAGRAVGFELRNFVVGPLGWRVEAGRRVRYPVRPARMAGFVSMVPKDDRAYLTRFAVFVLGGPLASVAWTMVVLGAWRTSGILLPSNLPYGTPFGARLAALFALIGLLGTVVVLPGTLLPYRIRRLAGFPTDALWLLLLLRGGEETRRLVAATTLTRLLLAGEEAEALPTALLEEATRLRDGTVGELNAVTIRWAATAGHDRTTARAMIARHAAIQETMGEALVEPVRTWARAVQASDAVFYEKDAGRGAAWLDGTVEPSDPVLAASLRLTLAGIAALRGEPDREARLRAAETAIDDTAPRTTMSWRTERARLAALRAGWPREDRPDAPPSVRSSGSA